MIAHKVITRPIITEKNMSTTGFKKYTSEATRNVTKIDTARTIEELFKVEVAKVNTLHVRGYLCCQGRIQGYTATRKKAVVSLTEGSKPIKFFEGMM